MEKGHVTRKALPGGRWRAAQHCVCICLAILSLCLTQLFISWAHGPSPTGVFKTTKHNVSNVFFIEVTMDRWTSCIDTSIPVTSSVSLFLSLFMVFKRNALGPVCCNPEVHPPLFYLTWPVMCVTNIGGLLLWDRGEILQALSLRLLTPVLGFYMLFVSYNNLRRHRACLNITSSKLGWFTYYATQNCLALSAWWSLTEALVNLGVVLKYTAGLHDPLVSTVILTLLFLAMLLWFILETFVLVKYIHYTFTVYPTLILGLGTMFTRGYQFHDLPPNIIYCGFLMVAATVMNCVMLFGVCCGSRHTEPIASSHKVPLPSLEHCPSVCQSVHELSVQKAKGNMA